MREAERLDAMLVPELNTGCQLFTGWLNSAGYGLFWFQKRTERAHRAAWILARGDIPAGIFVCHRCDTPACCNVHHLFLGTPAENMADKVRKGRHLAPQPRGETHALSKFTEAQVRDIKASGLGPAALGRQYGVNRRTIANILKGRRWAHV